MKTPNNNSMYFNFAVCITLIGFITCSVLPASAANNNLQLQNKGDYDHLKIDGGCPQVPIDKTGSTDWSTTLKPFGGGTVIPSGGGTGGDDGTGGSDTTGDGSGGTFGYSIKTKNGVSYSFKL